MAPTFSGATDYLPAEYDLDALRAAAAACEGCDLYTDATQTVFGSGTGTARLMLVGEQPGDQEDKQGYPFVGPAGGVLREALTAAELADTPVYVTNAVKHFRWKQARGSTRRLHDTPTAAQSTACRPWLAAELAAVKPAVLVALGATASGSLFGRGFRLTAHRGETLPWPPAKGSFAADDTPILAALATLHPSAVLRADPADRQERLDGLISDLRLAGSLLP